MTPLRSLLDAAEQAGVPAVVLDAAARELVALQLELAELRRCQNPRKRQTLAMAARIKAADEAMRKAGTADRVAALSSRFKRSRSQIHRLLKVSHPTCDSNAG
jgi:hypothetical protein